MSSKTKTLVIHDTTLDIEIVSVRLAVVTDEKYEISSVTKNKLYTTSLRDEDLGRTFFNFQEGKRITDTDILSEISVFNNNGGDTVAAKMDGVAVVLTGLAEIISFKIAGQIGDSVINSELRTISIIMPYGTTVSALTPTVVVSTGATVSPASAVETDFTSSVKYTVTAENTTDTKIWTISVSVAEAEALSNAANIVTFTVPSQIGSSVINSTLNTVEVEMPYGTDISALVPTFTLSSGASSLPVTGETIDFTDPVEIVVIAENGSTAKVWTVTILDESSSSSS
jgi:hypothetical protein